MKAHTLGEVGISGTVLSRVYSLTILPVLLKSVHIWHTWTKREVNTVFLRHGMCWIPFADSGNYTVSKKKLTQKLGDNSVKS